MSASGSELEGGWQATQLLQAIMDTDVNSGAKSSVDRFPTGADDQGMHKDMPSASPSRNFNSLPVYHFHGLAVTQTQTSQSEETTFQLNESSQKENISTSARSRVNGDEASSDPDSSNTIEAPPKVPRIRVPPADQAIPTHTSVTKPKSPSNNPIFFNPPYTTTETNKDTSSRPPSTLATTYPIIRTTRSPRAELEEFSQDSFAGPISQDPEQQFLAVSKQFEIPLFELGHVVSSPDHRTRTTRRASPVGPMFSYSGSNHAKRLPSPPPRGRILVAATPSNSDGSQSQPLQPLDEFQGHGQQSNYGERATEGDDVASQRSTQGYESSYPSSSYERLLSGKRDPDADVREYQATQLCTQEDVDMNSDTQSDSIVQNSTTHATTHIESANTTTHPRSLLSMVNPNHKWRYQKFQDTVPGLPQHSAQNPVVSRPGAHAAIALQETQPAFEEDEITKPPRRQLPKPSRSTVFPSTSNSGGVPAPLLQNNDQMDIVPDSEPLRNDSTSKTRITACSPHKRMIRLNSDSSDAIPSSGEIVSDSMAVDEHDGAVANGKRLDVVAQPLQSDEEIDDDDMPLAVRAKVFHSGGPVYKGVKMTHSNKEKASTGTRQLKEKKTATHPSSGTSIKDQGNQAITSGKPPQKGVGRLLEPKTIPSSIPGEETGKPLSSGRTLRANSKAGERAAKLNIPSRGGVKKSSTSTTARARDNGVHEQPSQPEDELKGREAGMKEEEDGQEPADDEYVETDLPVAGPSTRKRKRGAPPTKPITSRAKSKASAKTIKQSSVTPVTRQGKRLRTASVNSRGYMTPTRVFALWRHDGHYYPGVVQSHQAGPNYVIRFDDETEATVKINDMRLCELRVGDNVLFPNSSSNCKVVDVAKRDADSIVSISMEDEIEEVRISDLMIANKTVAYAWKDRVLAPDSIVPVKIKPSPTPSKLSVASGPSVRSHRRKVLAKTGLVITLSTANNSIWEKDRENIMVAVKNTGGTVIDDWASLFWMEGKHSHSNNRWVIEKSDVRWIGKEDIEKVFLLADNANQKPKFLIALGLGIPCVCVSWLHDSVRAGEDKEWQAYLLPQGYSEALHARPSQQIDMDWGNSVHQLTNIMDTPVACKLFDEKSILCVGQEMVPQPKGKKLPGTDEKAQEAHNAVARIILSMGARRVEAVSELRYASAPISEFDLIVIKEANHYDPALDNGCTVHWTWVKDCLVASRQLPLPVWGLMNSQEV